MADTKSEKDLRKQMKRAAELTAAAANSAEQLNLLMFKLTEEFNQRGMIDQEIDNQYPGEKIRTTSEHLHEMYRAHSIAGATARTLKELRKVMTRMSELSE